MFLLDLGQRDQDWDASDDSYGSEDDLDLNLEEIKNMHKGSKIAELMGQMDAELAQTDVGKTFSNANGPSTSSSSSGVRKKTKTGGSAATTKVDDLEEFDDLQAVDQFDLDMNTFSNMLESFRSQEGPTGPSATLLSSVGFNFKDLKQ